MFWSGGPNGASSTSPPRRRSPAAVAASETRTAGHVAGKLAVRHLSQIRTEEVEEEIDEWDCQDIDQELDLVAEAEASYRDQDLDLDLVDEAEASFEASKTPPPHPPPSPNPRSESRLGSSRSESRFGSGSRSPLSPGIQLDMEDGYDIRDREGILASPLSSGASPLSSGLAFQRRLFQPEVVLNGEMLAMKKELFTLKEDILDTKLRLAASEGLVDVQEISERRRMGSTGRGGGRDGGRDGRGRESTHGEVITGEEPSEFGDSGAQSGWLGETEVS